MYYINANYPDENFVMKKGDLKIEDGIIKDVGQNLEYKKEDTVVDCEGFYIVPGFVDIHMHGCISHDSSDGDVDGILNMAKYLLTKGVTSFCPTTMTLSKNEITTALKSIKTAKEKAEDCALIAGINMEGPFISENKKGAQKSENIIAPDFELLKELNDESGGMIKLVDVAPETENALEFIEKAKEICTVSLAHSDAEYDLCIKSFDKGISHVTHLFNAMRGLNHREPGVVGAVMDRDDIMAEIVCDGHHVHPSVVRSMFKFMGDRLICISDSMRLSGLEDGETGDLGGQTVHLKDGCARLEDGTIAGSVTNLHEVLLNLISWGIPLEKALKALSLNPAVAIGMDKKIGSIKKGKKADLIVLDDKFNICAVSKA